MSDYGSLCRQAALAQAILSAIEKHRVKDREARDVLRIIADGLIDGHSDWASEIIHEAKELSKDGRER